MLKLIVIWFFAVIMFAFAIRDDITVLKWSSIVIMWVAIVGMFIKACI